MWSGMNQVGEKPLEPLTLLLHPAEGSGESVLCEDAGNGFGYERGEYARHRVLYGIGGSKLFVRVGER